MPEQDPYAMQAEHPHFIMFKSRLPWRQGFAYFDVPEYMADHLFVKRRISIRYRKTEAGHPGGRYRIVFASCRKKDVPKALEALEELPKVMMICGHSDYLKTCRETMDFIASNRKRR